MELSTETWREGYAAQQPPISFAEIEGRSFNESRDRGPLKERFFASLPKFPFCSDDLKNHGSWREPKSKAITMPFIGPNTRGLVSTINVDLDYEDAAFAWEEANVTPPNWITKNRHNGRCHYGWLMEHPVSRGMNSSPRAINLYEFVRRGLTVRLKGDRNYSHILTKTPDHPKYQTTWLSSKPHSLLDFLVFLEPEDMHHWKRPKQDGNEFAERGRNCSLTSDLAKFGLRQALKCQDAGHGFHDFAKRMRAYAFDLDSSFAETLGVREVLGIVKSVTPWAWQSASHSVFSEIQRLRAFKRWYGHVSAEREQPWMALGVGRRTWYYRKAKGLLAPKKGRLSDKALCNEQSNYLSEHPLRGFSEIANGRISAEASKPWKQANVSRATWYSKRASGLLVPEITSHERSSS